MIKHIPNMISMARIFGTALLLFTTPLSMPFYIIYTLCGLSDVLDGTVARLSGNTTELGAKLDSIADLLYYAVMLFKIFPVLFAKLPHKIWFVVAMVILLRIASYCVAAFKYHRFSSLHTYLNKLTGALIFTVPYFISTHFIVIVSSMVCLIAGCASLEELVIHLRSGKYDNEKKSCIHK